jgi:hypothetical protein
VKKESAGGINSVPSRVGLAESNPRVHERSNIDAQYTTAYDAGHVGRGLFGDDRSTRLGWKALNGATSRRRDNDEEGGSESGRAAIYCRDFHVIGGM